MTYLQVSFGFKTLGYGAWLPQFNADKVVLVFFVCVCVY